MTQLIELKSLTFSGGQEVPIEPSGITILVGPNNSGKTSTLREIARAFREGEQGPVLNAVTYQKHGDIDAVNSWLAENVASIRKHDKYPHFSWLGAECMKMAVKPCWDGKYLDDLSEILISMFTVETRLKTVEPAAIIDTITEAPSHPLHVLYMNDELEATISNHFQMAFGVGLTLNRGAGKAPPLHFGTTPNPSGGDDRVSRNYIGRLKELPLLHEQGHGVRSFAGSLIYSLTSPAFVHLIDEPEVFLHPAHAKLLGGFLAKLKPHSRQVVIATHSGDFLRGMLDSKDVSLKVIRLTREGQVNHAHQLDISQIRELWADPILRFSNVLDGVFHDTVVVCEADSDCRFYAATMEAICDSEQKSTPDVLFVASGGKHRMPVVVRSLVSLGVKTRVIADFDVLRDQRPLEDIVVALGGDWAAFYDEWLRVKTAIEQKNSPLNVLQVKERINAILDNEGGTVTNGAVEEIRNTLRASSQWEQAKLAGSDAVYSGEPRANLNRLLERLREIGLFVVECGEIERFAPTVGGHGPKWVSEVLKRDLANDPELAEARHFVVGVLSIAGGQRYAIPPALMGATDANADQEIQSSRTISTGSVSAKNVGGPVATNVGNNGFWFYVRMAFSSLWKKKQ